jgi:hypothetical protein
LRLRAGIHGRRCLAAGLHPLAIGIEKQNVPDQEFGDVLVLVKLQKHVLVYGGGLKVEVGAEFFLPYWLVAQLSFNLPGDPPWPESPFRIVVHAYAPAVAAAS